MSDWLIPVRLALVANILLTFFGANLSNFRKKGVIIFHGILTGMSHWKQMTYISECTFFLLTLKHCGSGYKTSIHGQVCVDH